MALRMEGRKDILLILQKKTTAIFNSSQENHRLNKLKITWFLKPVLLLTVRTSGAPFNSSISNLSQS